MGRLSIALFVLALSTAPASAQGTAEPLFDTFNFKLEGSWVRTATTIRLDSKVLGKGTTLSFEDDLGLPNREIVPSLSFEWQFGRRHRLGVRWQDVNRDSTTQVLEEIEWGGEIIPVESNIALGYDIRTLSADYTYYPWVKERWAAGFGLGLRVMDISASLTWEEQTIGDGGGTEAAGTGPLPYLYFEYRRMLSENWRFKTGLGWLYVEIEDIEGGQWVIGADIEYLLGRHWSFGAAVNLSTIDVDWTGVETEDSVSVLTAALDFDVNDFSVFARFRF